jgi:hypothetical protein
MEEAEWLVSNNLIAMLNFAQKRNVSDRKFRLFGCAVCRRVMPMGRRRGPRWKAIEIGEGFADGQVSLEEREAAYRKGPKPTEHPAYYTVCRDAAGAAPYIVQFATKLGVRAVARAANPDLSARRWAPWWRYYDAEAKAQADLLRDVCGDIWRRKTNRRVAIVSEAQRLAEAIYDQRAFDHLPILADALEDSGFAEADLLHHLRSPGSHIRGCWALDLVLGKV